MSSSEAETLLRRERERDRNRESELDECDKSGDAKADSFVDKKKDGGLSGKVVVSSVSDAIESIGFGWFQIRLILSFGLITIADGGEMLMISLVNSALPVEWEVTSLEKGFLGSIIFVGVLLGSSVVGPLADTFGRRICVLVPVMGVATFGILSAFATSYGQLLALRCCVGTCIGCLLPTTSTLGAEFVPDRYRTLNMVCGSLFFAVGEVLISASAELIPLTGLFGLERFRCLLLVTTVPAVPGFLMIYFFVPESPHYIEATARATGTESAAQRGNKELSDILERMSMANGRGQCSSHCVGTNSLIKLEGTASNGELPSTVEGSAGEELQMPLCNTLWTELLSADMYDTTLKLWTIWFVQSLMFYGVMYILPVSLGEGEAVKAGDLDILFSTLGDVASAALVYLLIDRPEIGRRGMLIYAQALAAIFLAVAAFSPKQTGAGGAVFILFVTISKMMFSCSFTAIYLYTTEIFPTQVRATAVASGSAVSRVAGIIIPTLSQYLNGVDKRLPWILFSIAAMVSTAAAVLSTKVTVGKPLPRRKARSTESKGTKAV